MWTLSIKPFLWSGRQLRNLKKPRNLPDQSEGTLMIQPTSITHFLEQLSSFFHGDNPNLQTSKPQNHQNSENFSPPGSATVKGPRHTLLLSTVDGLPRIPPSYSTARGTRHPENPVSVISHPLEGQHLSKAGDQRNFQNQCANKNYPYITRK